MLVLVKSSRLVILSEAKDLLSCGADESRSFASLRMTIFNLQRESLTQRQVGHGERVLTFLVVDVGHSQHAAQLFGRDLHRAGRWSCAWLRLRESSRAGGVEGDVAFYFLHNLVNVSVEDGDGAE